MTISNLTVGVNLKRFTVKLSQRNYDLIKSGKAELDGKKIDAVYNDEEDTLKYNKMLFVVDENCSDEITKDHIVDIELSFT